MNYSLRHDIPEHFARQHAAELLEHTGGDPDAALELHRLDASSRGYRPDYRVERALQLYPDDRRG
jgi:hypothetical protein